MNECEDASFFVIFSISLWYIRYARGHKSSKKPRVITDNFESNELEKIFDAGFFFDHCSFDAQYWWYCSTRARFYPSTVLKSHNFSMPAFHENVLVYFAFKKHDIKMKSKHYLFTLILKENIWGSQTCAWSAKSCVYGRLWCPRNGTNR